MFVKIDDFIELKGFLVEFIESRRSSENQKPPENRKKSGLFWASPFTMHPVCTLLILGNFNLGACSLWSCLSTSAAVPVVKNYRKIIYFQTINFGKRLPTLIPLSVFFSFPVLFWCQFYPRFFSSWQRELGGQKKRSFDEKSVGGKSKTQEQSLFRAQKAF